MEELVVLVDENNKQIGTMRKLDAHNANTPLHRGFSCYVFNQKGEFLLTQRALSKKVWPGIWTNSCCGHPAPNENIEDAVKRRLQYELGLVPKKIEVVLPNFRYRCKLNGIVENEICPVYLARVDADPQPNPLEVEAFQWLQWSDYLNKIEKNPDVYSEWSCLQVKQLRENNLINIYSNKSL